MIGGKIGLPEVLMVLIILLTFGDFIIGSAVLLKIFWAGPES